MEKLIDSKQAAEFLAVNTKTLQRLARSGEIPGIKIGKLCRFRRPIRHSGSDEKADIARPGLICAGMWNAIPVEQLHERVRTGGGMNLVNQARAVPGHVAK